MFKCESSPWVDHPLCIAMIVARFAAVLGVPAYAGEVLYHAVPITPVPPATTIHPSSINDLGQVAGYMLTPAPDTKNRPFFWSARTGTIDLLPTVPEEQALCRGINNQGHVLIVAVPKTYLWMGTSPALKLPDLPSPSISYTEGRALNDLDQVVGGAIGYAPYETMYTPGGGAAAPPFLWTPGEGIISLGDLPGNAYDGVGTAINNHGVVVGRSVSSCGIEAFIWTRQTGMKSLGLWSGGFCVGNVNDINDNGQIVGGAMNAKLTGEAYLYHPEGGFKLLGQLPGPKPLSEALAINDHGTVVGVGYTDSSKFQTQYHFIWDATNGFRAITDAVKMDAATAAAVTVVPRGGAINNRNQLLGYSTAPIGRYRLDPVLLGDMNCDGEVNKDDLQPFIGQMLKYAGTTPPLFDGEECGWWIGDINQDALLNEDDLTPFLALLP